MDSVDVFVITLIVTIVGIIMFAMGFIIGYSNSDVITVDKPVMVKAHDLNWCLDQVKDINLFEKELYEKEWMSK